MNEHAERLRREAERARFAGVQPTDTERVLHAWDAAADEIDRLEAENATLRALIVRAKFDLPTAGRLELRGLAYIGFLYPDELTDAEVDLLAAVDPGGE